MSNEKAMEETLRSAEEETTLKETSRLSLLLAKEADVVSQSKLTVTDESGEPAIVATPLSPTATMSSCGKTNHPIWLLALVASGWLGIQMIWALEYALTTPFLTQRLQISYAVSGFIWSAGPITGLLVQPVIGSFSDTCTSRLGRRRPFIIAGVLLTTISSLFFSFSERIGGERTTAAIVIAVISFWMMDVSINMTMGPFRALLSDMASDTQQSLAQTLASFFQGLGQIVGFLMASAFKSPLESIEAIFGIAYGSMLVTMSVACFFAKEQRQIIMVSEEEVKTTKSSALIEARRGFVNMYLGIRRMPLEMLPVVMIEAFTWFAWFCFMPYATDWFGRTVFGGEPGSEAYQKGVVAGSRASAYQALVQLIFSFCCPFILRFIALKWTYMFCLAVMSVCFFLAGFIHEQHVATLIVALTGIGLAATNIFPFAIVGRLCKDDGKKGLTMGMLNIFIVIPQLVDTAYTGTLVEHFLPPAVMICAGCWALLATITAIFVRTTPRTTTSSQDALAENHTINSISRSRTILETD